MMVMTSHTLVTVCTSCLHLDVLPDSPEVSSPHHHPALAPPRISLLELMQSDAGDNSAESTAQHLLQHVAGQLTGSMVNLSQTVGREGEIRKGGGEGDRGMEERGMEEGRVVGQDKGREGQ